MNSLVFWWKARRPSLFLLPPWFWISNILSLTTITSIQVSWVPNRLSVIITEVFLGLLLGLTECFFMRFWKHCCFSPVWLLTTPPYWSHFSILPNTDSLKFWNLMLICSLMRTSWLTTFVKNHWIDMNSNRSQAVYLHDNLRALNKAIFNWVKSEGQTESRKAGLNLVPMTLSIWIEKERWYMVVLLIPIS